HEGYPMLMSLRHTEEVVPIESLQAPDGPPLDARELGMARQLIGMLEAKFEPQNYADEYRARVRELIEAKARGAKPRRAPARAPERAVDVESALKASLAAMRKQA